MTRRILFFLLLIVSTQLFSQRTTSSPYSIFGVGEEFGARTVEQIGMGGIGAAYSSNRYLNFINPAAHADLRYTTYAFGLLNNRLRVEDADTNESNNTTSLSYLGFGFPIGSKVGVVVGMQPTSAIGYSFINNTFDTSGNLIELTQFEGDGSVNRVYGGFGVIVFKGFSIGFEADFLFGNIANSVLNARQNVALATRNVEDSDVRGGSVKVGVQYKKALKNELQLNVGASITLANTLKATGTENLFSLALGLAGEEQPRDTLFSGALKGNLERPLETVIGIGIGKENKWYAELDYKFQSALNPTGFLDNSALSLRYGNSSRLSLGGFYIPKINSISSYWERVTYRAGFRIEKTGQLANGDLTGNTFTEINDFGISFGLGLPIGKRTPTNLNFTFEYGKKGTTDNGLLQENYLNLRLSLSLNDLWFIKRTID